MINIKFKDGSNEKGELVYINVEKDIGVGILLDDCFFLFYKWDNYYKVDKSKELLISQLALLELDVIDMKNHIEAKSYDFYNIIPVEEILMTAFHDKDGNGFSLYWKELALNWIESLKFRTLPIINLLEEKSRKSYKALPVSLKVRMRKIKDGLTIPFQRFLTPEKDALG